MRSISADLTAAQRAASTSPYVPVTARNRVGPITRYDFDVLDTAVNAGGRHDACQPDDNSLTRVRMNGGAVNHQRVTNPAVGPWNVWNSAFATGMGSRVACAARGARVLIVYTDAAGTSIRFRESTDNGLTFTADALLIAPAAGIIGDLSAAYKNSTGDFAVAWLNAANNVQAVKRVAGVVGGVNTWTNTIAGGTGLAMVYQADYVIALTGAESVTLKPTVWTLIFGDGADVAVGAWSPLWAQVQAENGILTFGSPFITITDAYRMTYTEAPTYTGGNTRTFRTWLHPSVPINQGAFTWTTPAPMASSHLEGRALAANSNSSITGYIYECGLDLVQRASRAANDLDLTGDIIAIRIDERTDGGGGYVDLDNSAGQHAGPLAPIQIGNLVAIGFGYYTASGNIASTIADHWIAGYEYRRSGGKSTLRLHLEDGWERLRRNRQRTSISHTATNMRAIISALMARAGLNMSTNGSSARAASITPAFTVLPSTSGYRALTDALDFLADRCFMLPDAGVRFTEPLAADASDYTLGGVHTINDLRIHGEPAPLAWAQAFGASAFGESIDFALAEHALAPPANQRDLTSTTGPAAAATATAHRRQRELDARAGRIICPPVCGLELLDVVDVADALVNGAALLRRVMGITWRYDRNAAIYEQELILGPR